MGRKKDNSGPSEWHLKCAMTSRRAAGAAFHVSDEALMVQNRCRAHIALARQVAMYLCHVGCSVPLRFTADAFRRDRTTVSHACRTIENRRDDKHFDMLIEQLEARVKRVLDEASKRERHRKIFAFEEKQRPFLYAETGANLNGVLEVKILPYPNRKK